MSELERKLTRFSRRVRWMTAWKGGAIGGTLGAITSLVVAALDYFRVVLVESSWLVGIVLVGAFVGGILGYFRRINSNMLADSIDRRAMLANRLGTAAEDKDEEMREIQRDDAIAHLSNLKPSEVYPIRVSRWHLGWMVASVLAAGMFILGNSPILRSSQDQADREALKKVAEQIERVAKPLLERKDEVDPETKKLAEQYKRLSEELKKARLPKEEAMQKANELAKEADQLSKQSFQESQQNIAKAEDSMKAMAQQKAMDEMGLTDAEINKEDLGKFDKMNEDDLKAENQNLSDQMKELSKQLASGKNEKGESLTNEEMESLKSQMKDLRKQIKGIELSQKVKDFMKKLQAMPEFKEIMKLLQQLAAKNAEGAKGDLKNPELTEEEIKALRKALEEKLKALEKMIDGMSDAQMKEMLENMKKAIEDALKNGCKACHGACLLPGLGGLIPMWGPSGPGSDNNFRDIGMVPQNDKPEDIKATADLKVIKGQRQEQGEEHYIEIRGPSGLGQKSKTPYFKVLPQFKKKAEDALDKNKIPREHQKRVKEYFDSLAGGK